MELLGNLSALAGCTIMVCTGLIKQKKHILATQCIQFLFMGLANLALGAHAGVVANVVSIARNLVFCKVEATMVLKLLFTVLQIALTLEAAMQNLYEWLPILGVVIFTFSLNLRSPVRFKLIIIFTMVLWLIYDLHHHNYVSALFDALTILSNFAGIWQIRKSRKFAGENSSI